MILYDKPECPFCWKVRLALHESGYVAELIDSQDLEHRSHWQALTPKKTVPVLVTDSGDVIYESNVILEYLAEVGSALLPATPGARIQARLLNSYSDTLAGPALREIIFEKRDRPGTYGIWTASKPANWPLKRHWITWRLNWDSQTTSQLNTAFQSVR